jgi:hypothetical protein
MNLYESWQSMLEQQTDQSFEDFWNAYSDTEIKAYTHLLKTPNQPMEGIFREWVSLFDTRPELLMGFLDGIQGSLRHPFSLEDVTEDSRIKLDADLEKLYFNMMKAEAEHLYSLPEWDSIFTEEEKLQIFHDYRRSRTVVKEKQPGRNDPCPCGSGKKYKKCCGKESL